MPIFEFHCPEHGKFEELITKQSDIVAYVNEEVEVVCPKCGKTATRLVAQTAGKHSTWSNWRTQ